MSNCAWCGKPEDYDLHAPLLYGGHKFITEITLPKDWNETRPGLNEYIDKMKNVKWSDRIGWRDG